MLWLRDTSAAPRAVTAHKSSTTHSAATRAMRPFPGPFFSPAACRVPGAFSFLGLGVFPFCGAFSVPEGAPAWALRTPLPGSCRGGDASRARASRRAGEASRAASGWAGVASVRRVSSAGRPSWPRAGLLLLEVEPNSFIGYPILTFFTLCCCSPPWGPRRTPRRPEKMFILQRARRRRAWTAPSPPQP